MSAESTPLLEIPGHQDNNDILLKNAKIDTSIAQPSKGIANITISQSNFEQDGYYLVQFKGYTKDEWKQAIRDSGAILYNYVPNNAFITKMNSSVKTQVETLDSVKWVGPYQPEYRISPALSSSSAIMGQETGQTNENITVLLFDDIDNERVSIEIMGLGGEIVINSGDRIRVIIAATKIPDISQINGVSWIEKYVQPVILNDVASNITNTYSVRNSYGLTGAGQIVAVADTGLDTGVNDATMHADIRGRIAALHAWWSAEGDSGAEDKNGHGTHVTGSVLGNGFLSNGKYSGMAPEARLVFQAMQYDGSGPLVNGGFYMPLNLASLFQEAYNDGAKIHSNSWGSSDSADYGSYTSDSQYVDSFMWNNPDMLIVFAAGNAGSSGDNTVTPPATAKNAISVGASENLRIDKGGNSDNINEIASFSSRGFTDDNRIKPDVVAPGTYIISTSSSKPGASYPWGILDSDYAYDTGSSMATPIVSGTAALIREYFVDNKSISPSAALIKATLINGAINLSLPKNKQGWGRVDIENSLFPLSPRTMLFYDNNTGLNTSQSWNVSYNVTNSSETLRITLVWSDYPGALSAGIELVNNLDLSVTGPSGTYYGNGAPDSLNNVEEVELFSPSVGLYTIKINGTNIPEGPQPFALVISGAFDIDSSPPEASDEYPLNNSFTNNNTTDISVNITDSGTGVNLTSLNMSINGIPVIFTNSPILNGFIIQNVTATSYTDGDVNVSINATDNASNVLSYSWFFTVDSTPPIITNAQIIYPAGFTAAKNGTSITLNASISDVLAGVKNATVNASQINSSLGDIVLTNNSGFWNTSVIVNASDGTYNLNIKAYDNAGNLNNTFHINVIVDNSKPTVTINSNLYQRGTAAKTASIIEFNISAADPIVNNTSSGLKNASLNVSQLNNTGIIALTNNSGFWNGNVTFDKSAVDGNYSLNVSFSDNAGNINNSMQANISIDNTPPLVNELSVSSAFINLTDSVNITVNITSSDTVSRVNQSELFARVTYPNGTSIDYNLSSGGASLFYKNFTGTALYGQYNITILANDTTGNKNSSLRTKFVTTYMTNLVVNLTGGHTETYTAPYSNTSLLLKNNNSINGTINISRSKVNLTSNALNVTNPAIYVFVNTSDDIRDNLSWVILRLNYTDADVSSYVESSLRLSRWNTTSLSWDKLSGAGFPSYVNDAGVDIVNNFVWANLTQFSEFAVTGDIYIAPQQQSQSGGGGGGGGSGGASGENYSNIELTEKHDLAIYKDKVTSYMFTTNISPIIFVNITGNVSFGEITTSVEVLRNISTMVKTEPPGMIYKNANIWVGSSSFNSPRNIKHGAIRFRILNSWIEENNISSVRMLQWNKIDWKTLETNQVSKDDSFTYYDALAQVFSNFAITGTKDGTAKQETSSVKPVEQATVQSAIPVIEPTEPTKKNPGFGSILAIVSFWGVYKFRRGKKNP